MEGNQEKGKDEEKDGRREGDEKKGNKKGRRVIFVPVDIFLLDELVPPTTTVGYLVV